MLESLFIEVAGLIAQVILEGGVIHCVIHFLIGNFIQIKNFDGLQAEQVARTFYRG